MPDKIGMRWLIILTACALILLAFAVAAGIRVGTWEICGFHSYPLCTEARVVALLESCAVILVAIGALIANEHRPNA
jgi:hypothetical protein